MKLLSILDGLGILFLTPIGLVAGIGGILWLVVLAIGEVVHHLDGNKSNEISH